MIPRLCFYGKYVAKISSWLAYFSIKTENRRLHFPKRQSVVNRNCGTCREITMHCFGFLFDFVCGFYYQKVPKVKTGYLKMPYFGTVHRKQVWQFVLIEGRTL